MPIDPTYPAERIRYMLEDIGPAVVVTTGNCRGAIGSVGGLEVVELDGGAAAIGQAPAAALRKSAGGGDAAYVIYTSGSTGRPKGVVIEHGSLINFLRDMLGRLDFGGTDRFLAVTTYSFDIAYLELLVPLIGGGRVMVVSREVARDGYALAGRIREVKPTHMQATPATWQLLLESGWTEETEMKMLIGGEAVREELKEALTRLGRVWNMYGPTETTIWSTSGELRAGERVTIGRPIANTQVVIGGGEGALRAVGVNGELYIGGVGVARGYLNQPELTAERFVKLRVGKREAVRFYRTGDVCRWLPGGEIEYVGRLDEQVKINGHRIELGEIENKLLSGEGVLQCAVVAREDRKGSKRLVAYIVPAGTYRKEAVIGYLRTQLPEFMVPSQVVELEELPLTANGKVDRRRLPDPGLSESGRGYEAPRTEAERVLAGIWSSLLGRERIGLYDSFFEIGGDSLTAIRAISAIYKKLGVKLPLFIFFELQTIEQVAKYIRVNYNAVPSEQGSYKSIKL